MFPLFKLCKLGLGFLLSHGFTVDGVTQSEIRKGFGPSRLKNGDDEWRMVTVMVDESDEDEVGDRDVDEVGDSVKNCDSMVTIRCSLYYVTVGRLAEIYANIHC